MAVCHMGATWGAQSLSKGIVSLMVSCAIEQRQCWQNIPTTPRRRPRVKIRVRVGTSRIAGLVLFAGQDIQQSTKIIRYIGEKITQEESDRRLAAGNVLSSAWMSGTPLMAIRPRILHVLSTIHVTPIAILNNSATPSGLWLLRISRQARKLTYNYGYELDDEPPEPCHCGTKNCCGYILGPQYWDRTKQLAPQ